MYIIVLLFETLQFLLVLNFLWDQLSELQNTIAMDLKTPLTTLPKKWIFRLNFEVCNQ